MHEYDEAVLKCFLENQGQLFPEDVAENMEEAEAFLEDCMAVVVDGVDEESPGQNFGLYIFAKNRR